MSEDLPHKDEFGVAKVYPSARPHGMTTYFTGAGDDVTDPNNPVIAGGPALIFDLQATDASKTVELIFSEDVYIKDGYMICENAPLTAHFDIEVTHPQLGILSSYAKKCPLFGTGFFPLDTDDRGKLPQGVTLKVTVYNSQPGQSFKVAGRIEMFRTTTV